MKLIEKYKPKYILFKKNDFNVNCELISSVAMGNIFQREREQQPIEELEPSQDYFENLLESCQRFGEINREIMEIDSELCDIARLMGGCDTLHYKNSARVIQLKSRLTELDTLASDVMNPYVDDPPMLTTATIENVEFAEVRFQ